MGTAPKWLAFCAGSLALRPSCQHCTLTLRHSACEIGIAQWLPSVAPELEFSHPNYLVSLQSGAHADDAAPTGPLLAHANFHHAPRNHAFEGASCFLHDAKREMKRNTHGEGELLTLVRHVCKLL